MMLIQEAGEADSGRSSCCIFLSSPVHTSNNVEATFDFLESTFDFVAKNGNNVE